MPKNKVNDPITGQEIAFACLILAGTMTDRQAAEAVGLHPNSAAHTKAKPRVRAYMLEHRAYMLEHRAAIPQQLRPNLDREQVLNRLWELAHLSPEMTRGSITGQVKAIAIIVAMENFIPSRRALSAEKNPAPAPVNAHVYQSAWLRKQQAATHATTSDPQPTPAPAQHEGVSAVPACPGGPWEPGLAPGSPLEVPPDPVPSQPTLAHRVPLADGRPPHVPVFVPDLRVPFSIKRNPFKPSGRPR